MRRILFIINCILIFILNNLNLNAQIKVEILSENYTDSLGRRQGEWAFKLDSISMLDNNSYIVICNYVDDKLEGYYRIYDLKMNLRHQVRCQDGKRNGEAFNFSSNGKVEAIFYFMDNQVKSVVKFFFNGKVMNTYTLSSEKKDGVEIFYHKNGKPWIKKLWSNGKLLKESYFYLTGNIKFVLDYETNDESCFIKYKRNGAVRKR